VNGSNLPPRRVVIVGLAALLGSFALGAVALRSARGSRTSEQTNGAREEGKAIRRAVDAAYSALPIGNAAEWHDISSVVSPLLSAGTSYDLAEDILWHAGFGFTWSRRTAAKPMDENLKRCMTVAVRCELSLWPLGALEASVTLVPDRRTRFETVGRTCAVIRGVRWT
jgi:hypothetical protein